MFIPLLIAFIKDPMTTLLGVGRMLHPDNEKGLAPITKTFKEDPIQQTLDWFAQPMQWALDHCPKKVKK